MELIPQDGFPAVMNPLRRISSARQAGKHRQPFQLTQGVFQLAVVTFVPRLGGIGPPVIFQVKLSVPKGHIAIRIFHILMDFFKKFLGVGRFDPRHAGNTVNGPDVFNHAPGGAASSVPVSVGNQHFVA